MTEIFRSRDSFMVGHLQTLLEAEGINTFFRKEHVSSTGIALAEFTPALSIVDEVDVDRSVKVVLASLETSQIESTGEVVCPRCNETTPESWAPAGTAARSWMRKICWLEFSASPQTHQFASAGKRK